MSLGIADIYTSSVRDDDFGIERGHACKSLIA
jgi:hypothetical protein